MREWRGARGDGSRRARRRERARRTTRRRAEPAAAHEEPFVESLVPSGVVHAQLTRRALAALVGDDGVAPHVALVERAHLAAAPPVDRRVGRQPEAGLLAQPVVIVVVGVWRRAVVLLLDRLLLPHRSGRGALLVPRDKVGLWSRGHRWRDWLWSCGGGLWHVRRKRLDALFDDEVVALAAIHRRRLVVPLVSVRVEDGAASAVLHGGLRHGIADRRRLLSAFFSRAQADAARRAYFA